MLAPLFDVRGNLIRQPAIRPAPADVKKLKRKTPIEDLAAKFEDFIDTAQPSALDLVIHRR